MDLKFLYNRIQNLVLNPQKEWLLVKEEDNGFRTLFIKYGGPLITLGSITLFLRNLFFEYSLIGNLVTAIVYFLSMFGSMYLSTLIINEFSRNFGIEKNKNEIANLVIYSSLAFYLVQAVVNMHQQLGLLSIFSLYSIYLYWIGTGVYFKNLEKSKMGFVVISVITIYISFLLMQYFLSPFLNMINNLNVY